MAKQTVPLPSRKQGYNTERRARERFPKDEEVWCQPVSASSKEESGIAWLGRIRDISPDGIGLNMSRRFEPETALIIELAKRPEVLPHLAAHVVHATPQTTGRWIIGCTFDRVLSPEELQTFLAE